ncbi:MAG: transposase [Chloroflexota bacterium]
MKQPSEVLGVKIVGGLRETSTPWAGASLLVDLFRRLGMGEAGNRVLSAKGSSKGLKHGQMVESFVLLSALGGDCVEDMKRLRDDAGLAGILGYRPPAPERARQWLEGFHDEALMVGRPLQGSFIPYESQNLVGLKELSRRTIRGYVEALKPGWEVTLDVDAQLIETNKANAKRCYDGYKAYQPMEVSWAETMLVVGDEFRDGNVPASKDIIRVVDEAYEMLPPGKWEVKVRSDSAAYEQDVLDHWNGNKWGFAVSADMSPQLRQEVERLPADAWRAWKIERGGVVREWAEVPYVPAREYEEKDSHPYRYVAIRLRRQQGELFEDGAQVRHFAVVTNLWDMEGQALLEWQRGKAGAPHTGERTGCRCISQRQTRSERGVAEAPGDHAQPASVAQEGSVAGRVCRCASQASAVRSVHHNGPSGEPRRPTPVARSSSSAVGSNGAGQKEDSIVEPEPLITGQGGRHFRTA